MSVHDSEPTAKNVALLVTTLSSFLTPFMASAVNIALPSIGREFSLNAVLLGWVATSYLLATAMFLIPFGKIADSYGRKKVFAYGLLIYTISSLLCALSPTAAVLISSRILQGIGGAMIFGTGVAILTAVYPEHQRGHALGINVAAVYTGLSLGPILGGILTQHFGWRSIFVTMLPLGLLTLVLVFWKLKGEWVGAREKRFDWVGSLVYGFSLLSLMYGFSRLPGTVGWAATLIGILGLASFVWWELRVETPVLNMDLFKGNTVFAFSNLAALINYCATSAVGFLLSLYLQYVKGLTPQSAGLVMVSQPVFMAVLSPLAGRLSDKIEPRIVASTGMALTIPGLLFLASINQETSHVGIVLVLALLGVGFALFSSPNMNAIMSSVEKRCYGVASATLATMRLTGQMLSMGIALLILAVYVGGARITPEYYPRLLLSMRTAFVVFAALCAAGVFASLARGRVRAQ